MTLMVHNTINAIHEGIVLEILCGPVMGKDLHHLKY
jgi:hypothetical protein